MGQRGIGITDITGDRITWQAFNIASPLQATYARHSRKAVYLTNQYAPGLEAHSVHGVLAKYSLVPALVEDLVYNIVVFGPSIPHMAREIDFRNQLPSQFHALTVTDNCISGTSAIIAIRDAIATG